MPSKILWSIDNEIDPRNFERMCADIFLQEGYSNIIPLGGNYDSGRDAELCYYDAGGSPRIVFFQFSLEINWEKKLKRELKKLKESQHAFHQYIFVTSQKVTGNKRDHYKNFVKNEFGWEFEMFEREWLRIVLEEKYPNIANKYLWNSDENTGKSTDEKRRLNYNVTDNSKKKIISEILLIENYYFRKTELFNNLDEFNNIDFTQIRVKVNELLLSFYDICDELSKSGLMNFKGFEITNKKIKPPTKLVMSFGMGIPIRVLQKVIAILVNFQLEFIDFVDYRQEVYDSYLSTIEIGTYANNDRNLSLIEVNETLLMKLLDQSISANGFYSLVIQDVKEPCEDW